MHSLSTSLWSSVGKKVLMALTGLFWLLYLVEHLIGNLLLLNSDPGPYNTYAHFILSFGKLLWIAEAVLIGSILLHIISGISVWLSKRRARPEKYVTSGNAGGPSRKTFSSTTMIWTGLLLLTFIVIHVWQFKFGAHDTMMVNGTEMLDLHGIVYAAFGQTQFLVMYLFFLLVLFFHLRHAFWSAFQSLGVNHPRYTPFINGLGSAVAVVIAFGFILIPIWIYITGGAQ